jgi:hypothetical protein
MSTIILFNTQRFYIINANKKQKLIKTFTLLKIFDNNLNNKFKNIVFNTKKSDLRKIKYLPSVSKE